MHTDLVLYVVSHCIWCWWELTWGMM